MFLSNGVKFLRRTSAFNSLAATYGCRTFATERANYVSVSVDPEFDGSVAVVKMQKKPVNSLCPNHFRELTKTIDDLEKNENIRAIIITSALPGIFSAGLDIKFMHDATQDVIYDFWRDLQDFTLKFYGSRLITIAAVNGHCVAGGNLIALAADYRVMADGKFKIGLNETKLGIHVPFYLKQMMLNLIGTKATARAAQLGTMFSSADALKIGLVEELVPLDQVLTAARKELKQWLEIPDSARSSMKMQMRMKEIQEIIDKREEDAQNFSKLLASPPVREQWRVTLNNVKN